MYAIALFSFHGWMTDVQTCTLFLDSVCAPFYGWMHNAGIAFVTASSGPKKQNPPKMQMCTSSLWKYCIRCSSFAGLFDWTWSLLGQDPTKVSITEIFFVICPVWVLLYAICYGTDRCFCPAYLFPCFTLLPDILCVLYKWCLAGQTAALFYISVYWL